MEYIEIEKKKYPVSFNMAAYLEIDKWTGMPVSEVLNEDNVDPSNWMKLLFLGLKYGADEAKRKWEMTYSNFVELMDRNQDAVEELSRIVMADITQIIELQVERYKLNNPAPEEDSKKNDPIPSGPTTSNVSVS